jgi:hypothetical protein
MVLGTTWQTPTGWMTVHDLPGLGPVQAEARRAAEITPIENHHPAHDQLSALLAKSGQIVLSPPKFLRGIRSESR